MTATGYVLPHSPVFGYLIPHIYRDVEESVSVLYCVGISLMFRLQFRFIIQSDTLFSVNLSRFLFCPN